MLDGADGRKLVQAKLWERRSLGVTTVREPCGVYAAEGADRAIVVTSGTVSRVARQFRRRDRCDRHRRPALKQMIDRVQHRQTQRHWSRRLSHISLELATMRGSRGATLRIPGSTRRTLLRRMLHSSRFSRDQGHRRVTFKVVGAPGSSSTDVSQRPNHSLHRTRVGAHTRCSVVNVVTPLLRVCLGHLPNTSCPNVLAASACMPGRTCSSGHPG